MDHKDTWTEQKPDEVQAFAQFAITLFVNLFVYNYHGQ